MNIPTKTTTEPPRAGELLRPFGGSGVRGGPDPGAAHRGPRVLLLLHDDCARCRTWSRDDLSGVEHEIRRWDGRILRVPSDLSPRQSGTAWIAIVDEWDEVFHVVNVGAGHAFPEPSDVAEWVRFVAIQCPECEGPEGPWLR